MILCKTNTHNLKSGRVQTAYKKPPVYYFFAWKNKPVIERIMGSEKDTVLEKYDKCFAIVGFFFFCLFLLKWDFLEGWSVFVLFCTLAGTTRVWEWGEQSFQPWVGLVDAHLMLHLQGRNHTGSWAGPRAAGSWRSREWTQGKASAAVFYPEGCAGTQYKQIQVLQREICASHKIGTQNLSQSQLTKLLS